MSNGQKKNHGIFRKTAAYFQEPLAPKVFLRRFFLALVIFLLIWVMLVWFLDPYICFHKAFFLKQTYTNSRAMIPGILRRYDYDTMICGSSMTQNFDIGEINRELGVNCIKATSAGLTGSDMDQYLKIALNDHRKTLKRCLIGVDTFAFAKNDSKLWKAYSYLYDESPFDPEYFLSADTFEAMYDMVRLNIRAIYHQDSRHQLNYSLMFGNKPSRMKFSGELLRKDIRELVRKPVTPDAASRSAMQQQLIDHIRNHKNVKFDIFLPPYSVYYWCYLKENGVLEDYLRSREFLAEQLYALPNAVIHDFQCDTNIILNEEHYADVMHYSPQVNTRIIRGIRDGSCRFTREEFKERTGMIRLLAEKYYGTFNSIRHKK
ncbi:MAG: hypothetical protein E7057_04685 [Lentisphaerae bacterium]|nr:hypothetical protein [Lentisphaerota bacterium]